jgi:anti-sigma factor RsiW
MITCRDVAELLFDFASGQILAEDEEQIEQHLQLCHHCVAYVESYHLTKRMSTHLPPAPMSHRLAQQLQALLENARTRESDEIQGKSKASH